MLIPHKPTREVRAQILFFHTSTIFLNIFIYYFQRVNLLSFNSPYNIALEPCEDDPAAKRTHVEVRYFWPLFNEVLDDHFGVLDISWRFGCSSGIWCSRYLFRSFWSGRCGGFWRSNIGRRAIDWRSCYRSSGCYWRCSHRGTAGWWYGWWCAILTVFIQKSAI